MTPGWCPFCTSPIGAHGGDSDCFRKAVVYMDQFLQENKELKRKVRDLEHEVTIAFDIARKPRIEFHPELPRTTLGEKIGP